MSVLHKNPVSGRATESYWKQRKLQQQQAEQPEVEEAAKAPGEPEAEQAPPSDEQEEPAQ